MRKRNCPCQGSHREDKIQGGWQQLGSLTHSSSPCQHQHPPPQCRQPGWTTPPHSALPLKGMRVAVFAQVMAVVYLLRHSFSGLVAGFLSQLFQCALTQPVPSTAKPVCLLVHGFPVTRLWLGWCLPWQSTVPSFPAQTTDVPSNVSSGTSSS